MTKITDDALIDLLDRGVFGLTKEEEAMDIIVDKGDIPILVEYYWKVLTPIASKQFIFRVLFFSEENKSKIPLDIIEDMYANGSGKSQRLAEIELGRREIIW